jgi:hypothetical protein
MTACSSNLQSLAWEAESGWAEDVDTMTYRVPLIAPVDVSGLTHAMIEAARVTQYKNDGTKGIPGPFNDASFSFGVYLTGHGAATSGATALTDLGRLLGLVFGASQVSAASGSTFTGGTASAPTTTASGTFDPGSLCRAGAANDNRGNGQFAAIGTHVTTTLNLLTALDAAPNNLDVLHSAEVVNSVETTCAIVGTRFRIQTADTQWLCHGCFPRSVAFSGLNPGEVPQLQMTWGVSWAEPVNDTFPTTLSMDTFTPAPVAAGSVFFNDRGTATRSKINIRQFQLDYQLGIQPFMGPDGVNAYQTIVGATRTPDRIGLSAILDAGGASATPTYWVDWLTNGEKHLLYTISSAAGSALGMYFARLCYDGPRPTQVANDNRNAVRIALKAYTNPVTTDDLTLSAFRMGLA